MAINKVIVTSGDIQVLKDAIHYLIKYEKEYNEGWSIKDTIVSLSVMVKDFEEIKNNG